MTFLVGGAVVLLGGAALVSLFGESPGFGSSATFVFDSMLADVGRVGDDVDVSAPLWIRAVVGITGTVVVVLAASILFRAPRDSRTLAVADEAKVRALLRDFGDHDSLGYFATRRDKAVVWDTGDPESAQRRRLVRRLRLRLPRQRQPPRRARPTGRPRSAPGSSTPARTAGRSP